MSLGDIMGKLVKLLVLVSFFYSAVYADGSTTVTEGTTTESPYIDVEEEEEDEMHKALNIDVGVYTTQSFEYFNNQFIRGPEEEVDRCIDEFIRCTVSLTAHAPVCGYNNHHDRQYGYLTTISNCDMHLENCRRDKRVWRILDSGRCKFWYSNRYDDIHNTFRRLSNPLVYQLLRILSKQSRSTELNISKLPHRRSETEDDWIYIEGVPVELGRQKPSFFNLRRFLATVSGNSMVSASK